MQNIVAAATEPLWAVHAMMQVITEPPWGSAMIQAVTEPLWDSGMMQAVTEPLWSSTCDDAGGHRAAVEQCMR